MASNQKRPSIARLMSMIAIGAIVGLIAGVAVCLVLFLIAAIFIDAKGTWGNSFAEAALAIGPIIGVLGAIYLYIEMVRNYDKKIAHDEKTRRDADAQSRRNAEIAQRQQQDAYARELDSLNEATVSQLRLLPKDLTSADRCLDKAQNEFDENIYSYFWEAVEQAIQHLGAYGDRIADIQTKADRYEQVAKLISGPSAAFVVNSSASTSLNAAERVSERMDTIVRAALKKFEFANIYEQRRTAHILVAGFTNLGQAINQMGAHISSAVSALGSSISQLEDSMTSQLRSNAAQVSMHHYETIVASNEARRQSQSQHRESLRASESQHREASRLLRELQER